MAKNVDGIYDSDPKTNPAAKKYDKLTYNDIVNQGLKVIDSTAATMCMENGVPTLAFGLNEKDSILRCRVRREGRHAHFRGVTSAKQQ